MRPETFSAELFARFGRDYRLRRSIARDAWCIEQQIGRAIWELPETDELGKYDPDTLIRARDGFTLICEVQARPFVVCEACQGMVKVPELTIGETWCQACAQAGLRPPRMVLGYIPLSETLLTRLERTSLKRHTAWRAEMEAKNAALRASLDRDDANELESILIDTFNRTVDIPQVGYGGIITRKNTLN